MVKLKNIVSIGLVGVLLMTLASSVFAATITATVDRSQANAGESIQLTLNIKGSPDDAPDFSVLQNDFDIVSQNQSSNMQIINGNISRQRLWVLTLMPKHEGDITIPSIPFGSDRSNAVKIHVNAAQVSRPGSVADDIFLQVDAEPKNTFVQAQVIYTVKVYVATNINNASLSEPKLSDADAVVKKLGKDRRFDTNYLGRSYQVVERRYAIFPQQSGKLRISPLTFNAQVIQQQPGFGMNIFQQFGRDTRLRSEAVDINVKPIPATQQAASWLPAAKIQLQDAWTQDPSKFRVGDAITRTVTLTAEGLTAAQLPKMITSTPEGFKVYPDQAALHDKEQDSGITGVRTEKMAMIASKPGHYVIPAIRLHWWNTRTQQQETALIPQRKIEVLPALADNSGTTTAPPVAPTIPQAAPPAITSAPPPAAKLQIGTEIKPGIWPYVSAFLGLGWLVTLVVLILVQRRDKQQSNKNEPVSAKAEKQESLKYIEKNLELTCEQGDPQAVKTALLKWAAIRFADKQVTSLSDLADILGEPAAEQINALNQVLYSPSGTGWKGRALWDAIQNTNKKHSKKTVEKEDLAPLNP